MAGTGLLKHASSVPRRRCTWESCSNGPDSVGSVPDPPYRGRGGERAHRRPTHPGGDTHRVDRRGVRGRRGGRPPPEEERARARRHRCLRSCCHRRMSRRPPSSAPTRARRTAASRAICAKRFYVHERVYEAWFEAFVGKMAATTYGDPFDPATGFGPMATASVRSEAHELVADAIAKGVTVHTGGALPEDLVLPIRRPCSPA